MEISHSKKSVLVGLSGGVDSAVCALVLQKHGFKVAGIHFVTVKKNTFKAAQKVAKKLGVSFFVEDISEMFQKEVVDYFESEYSKGRTPNPCVFCNEKVKYASLLEFAGPKGFDFIATGHYANVVSSGGSYFLQKAKDAKKDQTYFLYRLGQKKLSKILWPLGALEKEEVKEIAQRENLPVEKSESQDICFFAKRENLRTFLQSRIGKSKGRIVDEKGTPLGWHEGTDYFTLGQRHGLELGGKGPFYVFGKDKTKNTLKVVADSKSPLLLSREVVFKDANWIFAAPEKNKKYSIKTRYRAGQSRGIIFELLRKGFWKAVLEEPQRAVADGQSLVIYDGQRVVGGGIICCEDSK